MMNAKFAIYINGVYAWEFSDYSEAWERCKFSYEVTKKPCKLVTIWR